MFTTSNRYTLSLIAATLVASTLGAAQVGTMTTFQADTTAKASEVNNNFIVLKDAVNDNDTRLSAKQNRVSGACGTGFYMQAINPDGSVVCRQDINTDSGGDITGVTAGYGLTGGGTLGTVTLNANTSILQHRIGNTCSVGSSIRAISINGTVTCEQDKDTTYSAAGYGIFLNGTEFYLDKSKVQDRVNSTCAVGSTIRAIKEDGTVTCDKGTGSTGIEYKYNTSYSNFPTNGDVITLVYITITVPSSGYIYLTATGMFESKHVETKNTGYAVFGIMENTTDAIKSTYAGQSFREITPTMRHNELDWTYTLPFYTNRVVRVDYPGTYTYYFRAQRSRLDTQTANVYSMNMRNASLTGMFVPNRY